MVTARARVSTVEWEDRDCPLGCRRDDRVVLKGRDRLCEAPGEFTIVRCQGCQLMRTNPRPTPPSMPAYYPASYFSRQRAGEKVPRWRHGIRRSLGLNDNRLPPLPPGHLLEIGCAAGGFLGRMAEKGWRVAGMEASAVEAEMARAGGWPVQATTIENAVAPGEPYDLIVGWMVLEHLHEPVMALEKLRGWTQPGGWLVVSVPNIDGWGFQLFGDSWFDLDLPRHLYHFTPVTLGRVLAKGGWGIERVFHQRTISSWLFSLGYWLKDRRRMPGLARRLLEGWGRHPGFPAACLLAAMGQTGRMTVWARKLR